MLKIQCKPDFQHNSTKYRDIEVKVRGNAFQYKDGQTQMFVIHCIV